MKLVIVLLAVALLVSYASCAVRNLRSIRAGELECTAKPSCIEGSYVKARWGGQYFLKNSELVCGTLNYCNQNGVYSNCVKRERSEFGVKIEWCDCGSNTAEPSGCHIQLRTASWDGNQQYQCTGTCANGGKCIATKTIIREQISSTGANRLADVYCGCAAQVSGY